MTSPDTNAGFWRLRHDELEALLRRHDLSWGLVRVMLALADLTRGYGKDRDTVSLGQIADKTGISQPHVAHAMKQLAGKGLSGGAPGKGQAVIRWVVWPVPPAPTARDGTTATDGSSLLPSAAAATTANATASVGRHQDTKKKGKKYTKKGAADKPLPDRRVNMFKSFFTELHEKELGRPYIFSDGKDENLIKALLRKLDSNGNDPLAELQRASRNMLADPWGKKRADIGLLCSKINSWLGDPEQAKRRCTFTPAEATGTGYSSIARSFGQGGDRVD